MAKKDREAKIKFSADTSQFNDAIEESNKELNKLWNEFRLNEAQMENASDATENLEKKQKILGDRLEQTNKKTEALRGKLEVAKQIFGENSDEVKRLEKQLTDAQISEEKIKGAIDKTVKALEDQEEALEDTRKASEDSSDGFTVMKGAAADLVSNGIQNLIGAAKDAVVSFIQLADETREYREDLSKLNTAFITAGHTTEEATKVYKELYSVFGEEDRAVEAAQQIADVAKNEEQMIKMTNIATGAWARWGNSLATESLMEAIQSTSDLSEVQGTLTDALEWAGVNVDDYNEKLGDLATEEERTEYILETLDGLYSKHADNYRETNKSIIEANRVTSDYNDALAELGEMAEPTSNIIREGFTGILKATTNPNLRASLDKLNLQLSDLFDKLEDGSESVFPKLIDGLTWSIDNIDTLAVAIPALTVSVKGAVMVMNTAKAAQIGLNAAMAANPVGAVMAAVGLFVGVMGTLITMTNGSSEAFEEWELESQEWRSEVDELTSSWDKLTESQKMQAASAQASMSNMTGFAKELEKIAQETGGIVNWNGKLIDSNGNVLEAEQARVDFILGQMNEALGTEYTKISDVVDENGKLKQSIYDVIKAKQAQLLLDSLEASYAEAKLKSAEADNKVAEAYLRVSQAADGVKKSHEEYMTLMNQDWNIFEMPKVNAARKAWEEKQKILDEEKGKLAELEGVQGGYYATIEQYESAQVLILQGKTDEAMKILQGKSAGYGKTARDIKQSTEDTIKALEQEAILAGIKAETTKRNFESGMSGFTEEMVKEAKDGYDEALSAYDKAYDDAYKEGENVSSGLKDGMENGRWGIISKVKSIFSSIFSTMRAESDSHSPSRKAIAVTEDIGDGAVIGLENKEKEVNKEAQNLTRGIFDTLGNTSTNSKAVSALASRVETASNSNNYVGSLLNSFMNKPIELYIDGVKVATTIAGAADTVNGNRIALKSRGVAL